MEEPLILSRFDGLIESGLVLYDDKQETIEFDDGKLKVSTAYTTLPDLIGICLC